MAHLPRHPLQPRQDTVQDPHGGFRCSPWQERRLFGLLFPRRVQDHVLAGDVRVQLTTGLYCPLPEVLRSVRDEILDNGAEIEAAIREAKGFVLDESNKLKRLPKGYAPGSPYDEWLKLKDVYITERLAPEFMLDKELLKNTLHEFRKTKHFSDILNRAVQFAYDEMI